MHVVNASCILIFGGGGDGKTLDDLLVGRPNRLGLTGASLAEDEDADEVAEAAAREEFASEPGDGGYRADAEDWPVPGGVGSAAEGSDDDAAGAEVRQQAGEAAEGGGEEGNEEEEEPVVVRTVRTADKKKRTKKAKRRGGRAGRTKEEL
jgi:hypothetical protein